MFNKKAVIVVGAGASKEAGLPTGQELRTRISNLLRFRFEHSRLKSGDYPVYESLKLHVNRSESSDANPYFRASNHISEAMPQAISIDNFIDAHNGDDKIELCGKLAIVRSILDAERHSTLFVDNQRKNRQHPDFQQLEETWYTSFFQLLTENCRVEDLPSRTKSIALVVFNYDRCIEHFLYHALQNYYRIPANQAGEIVQQIQIYHPYGKVGSLPWQDHMGIGFGAETDAAQLLSLSNQIKTFTEGTDPDSSEVTAIRGALRDSNIVVFLGFAFHKLNMQLIGPEVGGKQNMAQKSCFATAKGISDSDCQILKNELDATFQGAVDNLNIRNELTCSGLFKDYWRSLSIS